MDMVWPHPACTVHQGNAGDLQRLPAVAHLAVQRHHVAGWLLAVCTRAIRCWPAHSPCDGADSPCS
jgi:hypothetical protein